MSNPEIIGLNQLPNAEAGSVNGDALLVAVVDGRDVLIRAADLGVEGGEPPEGAVTSVAGKTGEVELVKADVGLANVDNTADLDKPLSTAAIQRFEVIEGALGQIDPDAGFNPENIIGRTEFENAQATQSQALQQLSESIPSTEDFVTGQQLSEATSGLVTGQQLATALEGIQQPDLSGLVTTEALGTALEPYVKTEDLPAAPDLSSYVTGQQLAEAIEGIAAPDLSGLATNESVDQKIGEATQGLVTGAQLSEAIGAIESPDLSGFATTQALEAMQQSIPSIDGLVDGEALTTALQPYVKTEDLPAAPDLSGFATTQALQALGETIPSIEGLVSESALAETVDPINQAVQLLLSGLDLARLYWVNGSTGVEAGRDGSIKAPFRQIQEALDALTTMTQSFVLLVVPKGGNANYEPFVADGFNNVTIQGFGCVDAHSVRIDGKNEIIGETATRFRLKDISLWNDDVNEPALVIDTPLNRHYFQNVSIQAIPGTTAPIVDVRGDNGNWIDWNDCNVSGRIKLAASTKNAIFAMRDGNSDTCHIESDGGWKIRVSNTTRMGSIESVDDQVELTNVVGWTGKAGVAVTHESDTRPLTMHGCNLQKPDGTWLSVQKTGVADYQLSEQNVDPTIGVWNGLNKAFARPSSYYQPVPEFTFSDVVGAGNDVSGTYTMTLNGYPPNTLRFILSVETAPDVWEPVIDEMFSAQTPNKNFNVTASGPGTRVRLSVSDEFNPNFTPIETLADIVGV